MLDRERHARLKMFKTLEGLDDSRNTTVVILFCIPN